MKFQVHKMHKLYKNREKMSLANFSFQSYVIPVTLTEINASCSKYNIPTVTIIIQNEMRDVLALGVSPERIIYVCSNRAIETKMISHLKYAASCGVKKMTFESEEELLKVKEYFPDAK